MDDHAKSSERAAFKALKYFELKGLWGKIPVVLDKTLVTNAINNGLSAEGEQFDVISNNYTE